MKVLVFTTAYNEAKTVGDVLTRTLDILEEQDYQTEILVVDDASSDDTVDVVREYPVTLVRHPRNLGPGAATQTGYKYAVRNDFDVTVRLDADGQHRPEDIPKLLVPIFEDGADIVIGSRYKRETEYDTTVVRNTGIRFYSWLVSVITGVRIYDLTSGFRACRIEVGRDHSENMPHGILAIDRGLREGLGGYDIREVPVTMEQRKYGQSYLSLERLMKYPVYSVYSLFRVLLTRKQ
jgi:glycosyltransferase involved in cell wall biosynthesis